MSGPPVQDITFAEFLLQTKNQTQHFVPLAEIGTQKALKIQQK